MDSQPPKRTQKILGRIIKTPLRVIHISVILPGKYNQSECRSQILKLGKNAVECAQMIAEIHTLYPTKLDHAVLFELLNSGENYQSVFLGYNCLCEGAPEHATVDSAQKLTVLGSAAYDYAQSFVAMAQNNQKMYPISSDLKVIIEDKNTSVVGGALARHSVQKSCKIPRILSQYSQGTDRNHRPCLQILGE